ncbi:MAG: hypothetical protein KGZ30_01095 [Anaplasmataceae bacterium]|nr:hypothetical protein [Anaplasmataceae bacterium]
MGQKISFYVRQNGRSQKVSIDANDPRWKTHSSPSHGVHCAKTMDLNGGIAITDTNPETTAGIWLSNDEFAVLASDLGYSASSRKKR